MGERLEDKVALVTGAGSGMGAASARALGTQGASVGVTDIDVDSAVRVADEITAAGGRALPVRLDVADEAEWKSAIKDVTAAFGPVSVLHGNAAMTAPGFMARDLGVLDFDLGLWDTAMAVNLRGNVLGCRAVLPGMIEAGCGSIILTTSISSVLPGPARTAYAVSKAGVNALVRSVAAVYGRSGIRCNGVAPGFIATEATLGVVPEPRLRQIADATAIGRLGRPEEIAATVAFLASDESSYITGQILMADGGVTSNMRV
jgi:NAD(P)-dependent dehydrogenase (short-subunit alcohol dehydrogenase family)